MAAHHIIGEWHLEVTGAQLCRYGGQDAQSAFAAGKPYDAMICVDIFGGLIK